MLIWSRARDRAPIRLGPVPLEVGEALRSVLKRLRRLQQLLPEEKILATDWEEGKVPVTVELVEMQSQLQQLTAQLVVAEDKCRVQAWRDSMDKAWTNQRREVYRWVKGKEDSALVMLAGADGTLATNVGEMDASVRVAWGPIMCKYAGKDEPDEDLFMARYGKHVKCTPMEVTDLTGANLRAHLKRMSPRTPTSVDGSAAVDLRVMHLKV